MYFKQLIAASGDVEQLTKKFQPGDSASSPANPVQLAIVFSWPRAEKRGTCFSDFKWNVRETILKRFFYQKQRSSPQTTFITTSLKTTPSLTMYHMKTGIPTNAYMIVKNFPRKVRGTISPYPTSMNWSRMHFFWFGFVLCNCGKTCGGLHAGDECLGGEHVPLDLLGVVADLGDFLTIRVEHVQNFVRLVVGCPDLLRRKRAGSRSNL